MKVIRIEGGPLPTNCYILRDEETGAAAVVDPGFESPALTGELKAGGVEAILLTHGHFDHISGVLEAKKLTGAKIYLHEKDLAFPEDPSLSLAGMFGCEDMPSFRPDAVLKDGDRLAVGGLSVRVLHTPGHTAGSCCFLVGDALFSGDTLMCMSCGRTDLPTGSSADIKASLQKLGALKENFRVYPGHGPESTLEFERANNPFLGGDL